MYNSIQHFIDVGVVKINKIKEGIYNGKMDASDLSLCILKEMKILGTKLQAEIYKEIDDAIRESVVRKKYWNIEHRNHNRCHG